MKNKNWKQPTQLGVTTRSLYEFYWDLDFRKSVIIQNGQDSFIFYEFSITHDELNIGQSKRNKQGK